MLNPYGQTEGRYLHCAGTVRCHSDKILKIVMKVKFTVISKAARSLVSASVKASYDMVGNVLNLPSRQLPDSPTSNKGS